MSAFRRACGSAMRVGFGVGGVGFLAYPFVCTDTEFISQQTSFNQRVLAKSNKYLTSYRPTLGFTGGLAQAIYNMFLAEDRQLDINYTRHLLTMSDGGTISLDWAKPQENQAILTEPTLHSAKNKKRVCLVMPGLSGGSGAGYCKALARTLMSDGFEVAVFHNRGVENTQYTSAQFASLASTEEIESALEYLRQQAGQDAELVGVGLSMGANLMVKIAGIQQDRFPLKAIVSVNNPFDVWLTINLMRGTRYEAALAKTLRHNLLERDPKI